MSDYFDKSKPHPCERLARIEGQTNYWRLLAGVEEGADTTEDMGALSFARSSGSPPELLEAYWGGSKLHRRELCLMAFRAIDTLGRGIRDKDRIWTLGAVIDGFDRFCGIRRSAKVRAEHFKARREDYLATRKLAEGMFYRWAGFVQPAWIHARFRNESRIKPNRPSFDLLAGVPGYSGCPIRKDRGGKQPLGAHQHPDDRVPAGSKQAA